MKRLYLASYLDENAQEVDVDPLVIDDTEDPQEVFKTYFKDTYEYEIDVVNIRRIYPLENVFDVNGRQYKIELKEVNL